MIELLKIDEVSEDSFYKKAVELFHNWKIVNKDAEFRLTEIEFYWTADDNKDGCVYKRTHADPNTGEWFFHYSGVDIALKDDSKNGYGGILIRGIYDLKERKKYKGPLVSMMKLFSGCNAFGDTEFAKLTPHNFDDQLEVIAKKRVGIGKNGNDTNTHDLLYAFHLQIK